MRRSVVMSVMVMGLVLMASAAFAADTTGASARLAAVAGWCQSWGAWIILIGFLAGVAWIALNARLGGIQSLVAIPVFLIIVGAVMEAGPTILPTSAGAELTEELHMDEVPQP